jgi:hypothetical protein
MRRGLLILAAFLLIALSGRDAHAGLLMFGTQERVNHLQDINMKGPKGEALYLGFLTSMHAFMLPYSVSDGGYVLGIKGVSGEYYQLPQEKIEPMQRAGVLPNPLPVYRRTAFDKVVGHILWPALLIIAVAGFISSRRRESGGYSETRSA